jgi:hypothetical protein
MKKPNPTHLAMVICDAVIDDRTTGKKSLIGIFNNINASNVPCIHPRLNVFVVLTEGHGDYKMQLRCLKVNDEAEILKMEGQVSFSDPRQIVEFNCEIAGLKFPDYGDYRFEVLFDGNPIVARKFQVSKR